MTLESFPKLEEIDGSCASDNEVVVTGAQGNVLVLFLLELVDGTR